MKDSLTSLFDNVSSVLNGGSMPDQGLEATDFDGFDLVIVDNNLTGLDLDGARLTAETIIGYLRAFTDVPYIVSLNKNLHVDFDLRFLFGDYQSLADLALNAQTSLERPSVGRERGGRLCTLVLATRCGRGGPAPGADRFSRQEVR